MSPPSSTANISRELDLKIENDFSSERGELIGAQGTVGLARCYLIEKRTIDTPFCFQCSPSVRVR
jgi:hypothetical protein